MFIPRAADSKSNACIYNKTKKPLLTARSDPSERRSRRRWHRARDAVEGLSAAVSNAAATAAAAVIGRRGGGEVLGVARDDRDLVELVAAVVVKEARGARARCGPATPAITAVRVRSARAASAVVTMAPAAATASTSSTAATKRLDQPLGAGRHSTQVIQPCLLLLLLLCDRGIIVV